MAATVPNDVFFATIPELNARLKAKEFSSEELVRAFSLRLQQLGPGAEVIFIVKPHPNSKGEPIVIEKPSPALLQHISRVQGAGATR